MTKAQLDSYSEEMWVWLCLFFLEALLKIIDRGGFKMWRISVPFLIAIVCVVAVSNIHAHDDNAIIEKYKPSQTDVANIARANRVTHQADVWMNITNWGFYGNWGASDPDAMENPEYPGNWAPQCEFPGGSSVQYLFMGAPWIGALIEQPDSTFARVSVGSEGWTGPGRNQFELEPGEVGGLPIEEHGILERSCIPGAVNYLGENIYSPDAVAHQEFIAVYSDTLTEQFWVGTDIVDSLHFPLGVKVTQKAMAWNALGFEDFTILEFSIENIGQYDLKDLYLGFYVDGDVGWIGEGIYHEDDVTAFIQEYGGETWNVPFIADNDGRPQDVSSGNDFTCPGVSGIYGLYASTNQVYTSFNWWISNGNQNLDFGPSWQDDGSPGNWTEIYGTPNGDERKYFLMTNKELDYNQWYVADHDWIEANPQVFTDPFTGEATIHEWKLENLTYAPDLANGYDTRYLISGGPLGENVSPPGEEPETYLYPGESIQITFAYVCGDNFHDPENPQGDVSGNNPIDPDRYDYEDFIYNCSKAQYLFDTGYLPLLPYSPYNFRVTSAPDTAIWLAWSPYTTMPDVLVNIYRHLEGGVYGNPINSQPLADTIYVDEDVNLGDTLYYKAQAIMSDTILSCFTSEIPVIVGAPLAPAALSADSSDDNVIYLSWDLNSEPDMDYYVIYRSDTEGVFESIETVSHPTSAYDDQSVTNGLEYFYYITAVDDDDIESFPSDTVSCIAMGFEQHLLVIEEYANYGIFEWQADTLDAFYEQLFPDAGENPDFISIREPFIAENFPSLPDLSPYKIVWIIDDDHAPEGMSFINRKMEILEQYITNGGKVVISGRRLFSGGFGTWDGWIPASGYSMPPLLTDFFEIESAFATNRIDPTNIVEFAAAEPVLPDFPPLEVDTSRINLIADPMGPWDYLMEVDAMIPYPLGEIFYTFVSAYPDTSQLHGLAVGVRYLTPYMANTIITFPLFAMQPYDSVVELVQRILDDIDTGIENENPPTGFAPEQFALKPNYPNPFNPTTKIRFDLPDAARVNLAVYDVSGRLVAEVVDGWRDAGSHEVTFDGSGLASGVYFYSIEAGDFSAVRKMVLVK